ncbi:MAG: putative metallo-hydrolase YflN [Acidimicrobiales bacterium]|nr:MAG: MBL fold metallo-hydrolase [Actinomycetota bacterium]MBV6507857.1 putative metallo-hydrolase YflN [Acidimicrobiales bacterium]RIK06003.1 MAG: MBL fold metallo-hydrolase [Acidobacteriota bacterium]
MLNVLTAIGVHHISRWIFNCYLVADGGAGRPFVVDAGVPLNAAAVTAVLTGELGRSSEDLALVTATHCHVDHVAGAPLLHERTGAAVHLPAKARDYLAGEEPRTPGLRQMARMTPVLTDQRFDIAGLWNLVRNAKAAGYGSGPFTMPIKPTGFLDDGQTLPQAPDWEVIRTPGHTDDSISFYNAAGRTLLSGDAVLTFGGHGWFNPEITDESLSAATEDRLRSLAVDHLLPGHGRPVHGRDLMSKAWSFTDRARDHGYPLLGCKWLSRGTTR